MLGFFGIDVRDDAAAALLLSRMRKSMASPQSPTPQVMAQSGFVGRHDVGGACDGADWVVHFGFALFDNRVLDATALLNHFRRHGAAGMADLDGEIACAARIANDVFVARDRYGTRPLYWAKLPEGGHAFATSMRPLLDAGVSRDVDRGAVVTSLVLGYAPAPSTAIAQIRQVEPGHVFHLRSGESRKYYTPRERNAARALSTSARLLDRALTQAVERAPVHGRIGAFLSGGLDSSLVLARLREAGRDVEAYTLHFGDRLPSEIRYARAVARHVNVRHNILVLKPRAFCDAIETTLSHLEDLLSEPIAVPNFLLAKDAARTCDVLFTGEGGDPLFGGPKNIGMVLERAYGARSIGAAYLSAHHHLGDDLDVALTPEWCEAFNRDALERNIERRVAHPRKGETFVGQLMVTNLALKGGSNILVKVSKMVGAHDLALRSPLFDRGVVELGLTIPPWHKLEGTDEKIVLKRAVARSLPREVIERPKRGMAVPLRAWFEGPLGDLARDVLSPRRVRERGMFREDYVKGLLALKRHSHDLARSRTAEKLWLVLIAELHQRALARGLGAT